MLVVGIVCFIRLTHVDTASQEVKALNVSYTLDNRFMGTCMHV